MKIHSHKPEIQQPADSRVTLLVLLGVLAAVYLAGMVNEPLLQWFKERGHAAFVPATSNRLVAGFEALGNYTAAMTADVDIPVLVLDVKFKHMRKIHAQRNQALIRGQLVQTDASFVPAKIRFRNSTVPVKIRLKGDHTDHIRGDKWSLRVHVRKGAQVLGMRRFSVQNPSVRDYQAENLFFRVLREFDVLTPRYLYVKLVLNGEDIGIMALEEHFSKELLESQRRREGVIVRYDENLVWQGRDGPAANGFYGIYDDYRNTGVDVFQGSKVAKSATLSAQAATAMGMLRAFSEDSVTASEIFDADTLGAYLAVSEVMGARHAIRWHNQRFYMSPITQKMEPIAYDANLRLRESGLNSTQEALVQQMLQDPKVFARFKQVLGQLLAITQSGELRAMLSEEDARVLDILHSEYIFLQQYPVAKIARRTEYLASLPDAQFLTPQFSQGVPRQVLQHYPNPIRAYRIGNGNSDSTYFEITSATPLDADITGFETAGGRSVSLEQFPLPLPGRSLNQVPSYTRVQLDQDVAADELSVVGMQNGRTFKVPVINQYAAVNRSPIPATPISELLASYSFLSVHGTELHMAPGTWSIDHILALPAGYTLHAGPGTTLRFGADAMLIARDSVFFEGTEDAPVQLLAQANVDSWKGFVAFTGSKRSRWSHVLVQDTRGVQIGGWKLMGGTNFYRNDVDISDTSIERHKGEDGLNIISSDVLSHNLRIVDTLSDGFDCDFCTGSVNAGLFRNIGTAGGGDAVDVSTSKLTVIGTRFENVNDKAVSVGEASHLQVSNLDIIACGTGAAAKDGSVLEIKDSRIIDSSISALMAYIKKPEFGVAEVIAQGLEMSGNRVVAVAQTGSRVTINGELLDTVNVNVDELYNTVMRPGLRRPNPPIGEQSNAGT